MEFPHGGQGQYVWKYVQLIIKNISILKWECLSHCVTFWKVYFTVCVLSEGAFISFLILQFHSVYKIQIRKGKKNKSKQLF